MKTAFLPILNLALVTSFPVGVGVGNEGGVRTCGELWPWESGVLTLMGPAKWGRPTQEGARGEKIPIPLNCFYRNPEVSFLLSLSLPHSILPKVSHRFLSKSGCFWILCNSNFQSIWPRICKYIWDTLFSEALKYFHLPELLTCPSAKNLSLKLRLSVPSWKCPSVRSGRRNQKLKPPRNRWGLWTSAGLGNTPRADVTVLPLKTSKKASWEI